MGVAMTPATAWPRGCAAVSSTDCGFTLLETVFALSVLLVVALGLLPLGVVATTTTENQGHLMARTTEYAQDKMEQLLSLAYGDVTSDTRVFPAASTGGTGLAIGGSENPDAPVALYVDYLDVNGTMLPASGTTAPASWFYKRVWKVESGGTNLKKITVTATTKSAAGSTGRIPRASIASIKTFPF
jgi:prepilin-type N-terminal cleavage/methylation domain-containing protein